MRYRGFIITSQLGKWTEEKTNLVVKTCSSFYCQVYSGSDNLLQNMLDKFELTVGRDIADMSDNELKRGIIQYIDAEYERLEDIALKVVANRNADLLGQMVRYLSENKTSEDLYLILHKEIGMTDDEIREAGLLSLVPFFDKESYAQTIAAYLVDEGTKNAFSSNYTFEYYDINARFGVTLPSDIELINMVKQNLDKDVVDDVLMDKDIDIMFYTQYCPNAENAQNAISFCESENAFQTDEKSAFVNSRGMSLSDFIYKVSDMIDGQDKTAALNWIALAQNLCDTSENSFRQELHEIYLPLRYVQNNFNNAVLQKSLNTMILGNEIIYGAMLFAAGYSSEEVNQLANDGILEYGFIPLSENEKGSLSLVYIADTDTLFIAQNETSENLFAKVAKAATIANSSQQDLETILLSPTVDIHTEKIENQKLIDAVKMTCSSSSAFDCITVYDSTERKIWQGNTSNISPAQRDTIFYICASDEGYEECDEKNKHAAAIYNLNDEHTSKSVETSNEDNPQTFSM